MASPVFPFSSFLSSVFLLSQEQSMEINLSCRGTVRKTIAFDLCYLLAICIHKILLFIIIVFLSSYLWLSSGIYCQFYFSFHAISCDVRWGWSYWLEGIFHRGHCLTQMLTCSLFKAPVINSFILTHRSNDSLKLKVVPYTDKLTLWPDCCCFQL